MFFCGGFWFRWTRSTNEFETTTTLLKLLYAGWQGEPPLAREAPSALVVWLRTGHVLSNTCLLPESQSWQIIRQNHFDPRIFGFFTSCSHTKRQKRKAKNGYNENKPWHCNRSRKPPKREILVIPGGIEWSFAYTATIRQLFWDLNIYFDTVATSCSLVWNVSVTKLLIIQRRDATNKNKESPKIVQKNQRFVNSRQKMSVNRNLCWLSSVAGENHWLASEYTVKVSNQHCGQAFCGRGACANNFFGDFLIVWLVIFFWEIPPQYTDTHSLTLWHQLSVIVHWLNELFRTHTLKLVYPYTARAPSVRRGLKLCGKHFPCESTTTYSQRAESE